MSEWLVAVLVVIWLVVLVAGIIWRNREDFYDEDER